MSTTLSFRAQPHWIFWARTPIISLIDGPSGPEHEISRVLLAYAQISNNHPCWRIPKGERPQFWSESSSSSILCVCEQRRLWWVLACAQTRLSPNARWCNKYRTPLYWPKCPLVKGLVDLQKYFWNSSWFKWQWWESQNAENPHLKIPTVSKVMQVLKLCKWAYKPCPHYCFEMIFFKMSYFI